ncbi:hypothetical protein BD310DRAFT_933356 [Dichomitus squalens]|uniref:Uncharacterized protein n=1 Tax=Dichomitus squalens TaxID=114155 RepID=A0A4Q9PMS8_9APHY|nr:hypothetical protein BD310DRAFT_933356 [Dichomitus squalens]
MHLKIGCRWDALGNFDPVGAPASTVVRMSSARVTVDRTVPAVAPKQTTVAGRERKEAPIVQP